nr:VanW family protein [uncultured Cellulosilyticum sp.]
MTKHYSVFIFQLVCSIIALALGVVIGTSLEFASYKNKVFKNISIGDVPIGSESLDTAYERVNTHYMSQNTKLALTLEDKVLEIPLASFITGTNINELIETAFAYSQHLSLIERYKLLTDQDTKTFEVEFIYDEEAINQFVDEFIALASRPSKDAKIRITSTGDMLKTPDISGIIIDSLAVKNAIYKLLTPNTCINQLQFLHVAASNIPILLDIATFTTKLPAHLTAESLNQIDARVASFSTSFTPGTGSDINIAVAAKTINGTLLMPGESFSYNEAIGNTTLDKGYTYATVIVNSQPTKGVGGGVCQVSTTLYNAILLTGILPTERKPHSRPSSYVPLGLDATIDWGNIDFKFTNTLKYPIYIVAYTTACEVYVDIYSNKHLLSTTYKLNSEILTTMPSTTQYIKDPNLPSGTTQLVSNGATGYQVKVSRETYQNGALIDTTTLYQDTYAAVPTIYKVGS